MTINDILNDRELNNLMEDSISKTYYKYVWNNSYLRQFIDKDDFTQECYIFIMKHIKSFDSEKSSIRTFIPMVVMSGAKNQIRTAKRNKQEINNCSLSMDMEYQGETNSNSFSDLLSDEKINLEKDSINNLYIENILQSKKWSELEINIVKLLLEEYTPSEIARMLNLSRQYISKKRSKIADKLVALSI